MESVFTQKAARVLRVLMLIALGVQSDRPVLVPTAVLVNANDPLGGTWTFLAGLFHPGEDDIQAAAAAFLLIAWAWCWATPHTFALTAFLLCSGCCTAQILRQGLRVVDTILQGKPFSMDNAVSLRRAAVCSFVISGAALARTVFSVCYYRSVLAPRDLQRSLRSHLRHGGTFVPGDVRPVPPGGGDEGGERLDHIDGGKGK